MIGFQSFAFDAIRSTDDKTETPNCATIVRTSSAGTDNQTVCPDSPIIVISYVVGNGGTGATISGLPAGITMTYSAAAQTATIAGSSPFSGVYNYTITTVGGACASSLNGTITVSPNVSLSLSSAPATTAQTVCLGTPIVPIVYVAGNGATGATIIGLPSGVTAAYAGGIFTISGTPTISGSYNYSVSTSGGCSFETLTGIIIVSPNVSLNLTSSAATANQTVCPDTAIFPIQYVAANGAIGVTASGLPSGVTGTYVSGAYTISGTPTAPGIYPYSVITIGGCGSVILSGMIEVYPNATIALTSALATDHQIVCDGSPLVNIVYTIGNGATGASLVAGNFPAGITSNFAGSAFTISGTPTVSGVFNYSIMTTGGCGSAEISGTITVVPNASLTLTSGTPNQTLCEGWPMFPIVYHTENSVGITATGLPDGVTATLSAGEVTVSGVPVAAGLYNFAIVTAGSCSAGTQSGTIVVNPNMILSLQCTTMTANSITFDWMDVPGATSYEYAYAIGSGTQVSGSVSGVSDFTVTGVSMGQTVVFQIVGINGPVCAMPDVVTCLLQPLANETFGDDNFAHYPNPMTEVLYLEYDKPFTNITIYNAIGQQVLRQNIGATQATIGVSQLQSGIYFAKVGTSAGSKTIRLVKN